MRICSNNLRRDEQRLRPREKGPNDPHLGTIDRNFKCSTCEESMAECPGHFGVIKLAEPVFHYGFLNRVKKILETICHNCGKIKAIEVCSHTLDDSLILITNCHSE